jgi:hypothetical protein
MDQASRRGGRRLDKAASVAAGSTLKQSESKCPEQPLSRFPLIFPVPRLPSTAVHCGAKLLPILLLPSIPVHFLNCPQFCLTVQTTSSFPWIQVHFRVRQLSVTRLKRSNCQETTKLSGVEDRWHISSTADPLLGPSGPGLSPAS